MCGVVHSVKIINSNDSGGEVVNNDLKIDKFPTIEVLKSELSKKYSEYTEGCDTKV